MAVKAKIKKQLDKILNELEGLGNLEGQKIQKQAKGEKKKTCPFRILAVFDHGTYFVVIYQDTDCKIKMHRHPKGL